MCARNMVKTTVVFCMYKLRLGEKEIGKGGGVAIFIKSGVRYKLISKGKEYESVVIEVWSRENSIKIVNFYNPCNKLGTDMLELVCGSMQGKVVVCVDFNEHNTL